MNDCIFCKIVRWELPSWLIWEDDKHYAFLDLFPNCKWQALVIPKKHCDSKVFEMEKQSYSDLMLASKSVSHILKDTFGIERVGMIMEWMGVNHAHIKLYPMHWLDADRTPDESTEKVFYDEYPGFLTTKTGEMLDQEKISSLLQIIKKN